MTACVQLQVAASSSEEADRLAAALLEPRLAACVQIVGPVRSRYWWDGELETATEWLCVAKTTADRVEAAEAALVAIHCYDTPEILVVAAAGSSRYLDWIDDTVHTNS
ncbi:MAG: divalent-cation tolerance protein CutA [Acidimicrobiales bacterium]